MRLLYYIYFYSALARNFLILFLLVHTITPFSSLYPFNTSIPYTRYFFCTRGHFSCDDRVADRVYRVQPRHRRGLAA
ncbi:hypothetical protein BC629DRAFT_995028 [Irpex lacteus]|nr:hypothetical protein BC629DRAFT_995028 [Irpex lacteus]